jgi:hypothetical protein
LLVEILDMRRRCGPVVDQFMRRCKFSGLKKASRGIIPIIRQWCLLEA